jgi:hypothetical protein
VGPLDENSGLSTGPHLHYEVIVPPPGVAPSHAEGGPIGIQPFWYRVNPDLPFPGNPEAPKPDWWDSIKTAVSDFFTSAQNVVPRSDPLVLDLDADGIETLALNPNSPILFDHDGDGVKTGTGWVAADDGILVLDRNGNGTIDSGRELFGESANSASVHRGPRLGPIGDAVLVFPDGTGGVRNVVDGFEVLIAKDSNADGRTAANDTAAFALAA